MFKNGIPGEKLQYPWFCRQISTNQRTAASKWHTHTHTHTQKNNNKKKTLKNNLQLTYSYEALTDDSLNSQLLKYLYV